MAILDVLSNELLLQIIADVSPLYLGFFLLSCKRVYFLGADTIREHALVRNSLMGLDPCDLLEKVYSDARTALYPTSIEFQSLCGPNHQDGVINVDAQTLKDLFIRRYHSTRPRPDFAIPLLFTLLLNLRKLDITVGYSPYLLKIVAQIVEASHEPRRNSQELVALGRLTEVVIRACCDDDTPCDSISGASHAMKLSSLLAMIPSVMKLKIFVENPSPYDPPHPYHFGGVTDLYLSGAVDFTFLDDLIDRTEPLEKFTYQYEVSTAYAQARFTPRRVTDLLQQCAADSLLYLDLILRPEEDCVSSRDYYRQDLFIGSLQDFAALKTLRTSVDLFLKTRRPGGKDAKIRAKMGTIQNLMSILPLSLETLVLDKGLDEWDDSTVELLFEDIDQWKELEDANLKLVNFAQCPYFEEMVPLETETACYEAGVKLGYSVECGGAEGCDQIFEKNGDWEQRPWIQEVICQCEHHDSDVTSEHSSSS